MQLYKIEDSYTHVGAIMASIASERPRMHEGTNEVVNRSGSYSQSSDILSARKACGDSVPLAKSCTCQDQTRSSAKDIFRLHECTPTGLGDIDPSLDFAKHDDSGVKSPTLLILNEVRLPFR